MSLCGETRTSLILLVSAGTASGSSLLQRRRPKAFHSLLLPDAAVPILVRARREPNGHAQTHTQTLPLKGTPRCCRPHVFPQTRGGFHTVKAIQYPVKGPDCRGTTAGLVPAFPQGGAAPRSSLSCQRPLFRVLSVGTPQ